MNGVGLIRLRSEKYCDVRGIKVGSKPMLLQLGLLLVRKKKKVAKEQTSLTDEDKLRKFSKFLIYVDVE